MFKRLIFFYTLLFLIFLGYSCAKRGAHYPTQYMSQEFKDYADFMQGSYWVYVDSTNYGNLDSISLASHSQHVVQAPQPYEIIEDSYNSSKDGGFTAFGGVEGDSGYCNYYILDDALSTKQNVEFFNSDSVGAKEKNDGILIYISFFDTLTIAGNKFKNVKEFHAVLTPDQPAFWAPVATIYWAKNIGMVKEKITYAAAMPWMVKTWELKRYHVIQ